MAYGKSNGHVIDNVMTLKGECHDLNMSGPTSSTAAADTDLVTMTTTLTGQGHDCQSLTLYFPFRDTTFHLVLALFASLRPKYGTPHLFTSANPKHTLPSDVMTYYFLSAHLAP